MSSEAIALLCSCAATLVTLIGVIWQASKTVTELRMALDEERREHSKLQKAIEDMSAALERLSAIPLHEQRIAQLEHALVAATTKVDTLWRKLFSVDKHVAVLRAQSSHDIEDHVSDTDPPPRND